ncbi:uncharacterized protein G2W53_026293 [Senna tora]|uniref:Uncharacterized protein n=1 Tax=Senna tora TaxID=362788 RepID=A0A834TEX4_9FABA|nr:uncharacterized protein G2W53_026293 [Senna tora]
MGEEEEWKGNDDGDVVREGKQQEIGRTPSRCTAWEWRWGARLGGRKEGVYGSGVMGFRVTVVMEGGGFWVERRGGGTVGSGFWRWVAGGSGGVAMVVWKVGEEESGLVWERIDEFRA